MKKKFIIGKNCIHEVLTHQEERIQAIRTSHSENDPIIKTAATKRIKIIPQNNHQLEKLVNSSSHQGFVAELKPRENIYIEDIIEQGKKKKNSLVVLIDSIFDPHNVGAILRSCECYGIDGFILSKNKGCKITPVVSKTSVGASEFVPTAFVSNLATTVEKFQKEGYWSVSCELSKSAESIFTFSFPEKTLLILGSEGSGVQKILSKKADFKVYIPMSGVVDSLNVSQAGAVFMHSFRSQYYT